MPIISVSILAGRPAKAKQQLLKALSDATVTTLGVPASTVRILLTEVAPENWAVGGISKAQNIDTAGDQKT